MMVKSSNRFGRIGIENAVYARIAAETIDEFDGRLILTNQRGRIIKPGTTGRESLSYIEVTESKEAGYVDLKVYVIVRFGCSISRVSEEYAGAVRRNSEEITGVPVKGLTLVITGIKSDHIIRRNQEIIC